MACQVEVGRLWQIVTTLNMTFIVTYYLELCNAITLLCILFFANHGRIGCLDTLEHYHLYLIKKSTFNTLMRALLLIIGGISSLGPCTSV